MIYETGNRVINELEKRFGNFALPKVLRWIAGFQVLSWALSLISPEFLDWIIFDRNAILSGQVWRLLTWVLFPASDFVLFVIIAAMFMFFINDSLESEWESFRLNLYVFGTLICLSLAGLMPVAAGAGMLLNSIFYSAVFLAFASLFPNQIIHLFGIIPIKAKWLGWVNAAFLGAIILTSAYPFIVGIIVLLGLLPFLLTFVPGFITAYRQQTEVAVRRHRFEKEISGGEAFHDCETCGATEKTHPEREFRVAADGNEYCSECRKTA